MGLPIIEWREEHRLNFDQDAPMVARSIDVEERNLGELPNEAGDWEIVSGVTPDGMRVGQLETESKQPLTTRGFRRALAFKNLTGGVDAIVKFDDVSHLYDPPGLVSRTFVFTDEDWIFRGWARASTGTVDSAVFRIRANDTGGGGDVDTDVTLSTITTTWQMFNAVVRCTADTDRIDVRITMNDNAALTTLWCAGLFCGRCIDFEKRIKLVPDIVRVGSRVRSLAGVTQTDTFREDEKVSVMGNDEDAEVYKNFRDLWTHASLGGHFGAALDRASRDNLTAWVPKVVLTQDSGLIARPVGAERYRLGITDAVQQRTQTIWGWQ
tara:strand:+ start:103 stop:1074 length:972 start_codon:yes stop_codon:yes gene_type:complete